MSVTTRNRVKFALAGDVLEWANPLIPGHPHGELVRLAGVDPIGSALELCAGTGYAARLLARAHPETRVYGLDISPEMVAVGRRKLAGEKLDNVELITGDAGALCFPDRSLDLVMSVFGLHELPTEVRRRAVAESARVLRPGGRFITLDMDKPSGPGGLIFEAYLAVAEPRHARGVIGNGLTDLLTEVGFAIDSSTPASVWRPLQAITARAQV